MDQGPKEPSVGHTTYVGKVFVVGKHTVTIEDTIAEGKISKILSLSEKNLIVFIIDLIIC